MSINVFQLLFFIFRLSNMLPVNTKSLFKLSSSWFNIFLIATAADNYIYQVGSFAIEIRLQSKLLSQQKQLFPHFVVLKVGLFVEKFEEHKSLFKLDDCLLQLINLCLANILP